MSFGGIKRRKKNFFSHLGLRRVLLLEALLEARDAAVGGFWRARVVGERARVGRLAELVEQDGVRLYIFFFFLEEVERERRKKKLSEKNRCFAIEEEEEKIKASPFSSSFFRFDRSQRGCTELDGSSARARESRDPIQGQVALGEKMPDD